MKRISYRTDKSGLRSGRGAGFHGPGPKTRLGSDIIKRATNRNNQFGGFANLHAKKKPGENIRTTASLKGQTRQNESFQLL